MEQIKKAVARAKAARQLVEGQVPRRPSFTPAIQHEPDSLPSVNLNRAWLESQRIIAHQGSNSQTARFDMLRTKVLQDMRERGLQTLVLTSPTVGCGKTVTAINLAMSIARLAESYVVLADLDLRRPQLSNYLGLKPQHDISDVLSNRASLQETLITTDVVGPSLAILPTSAPVADPSEVLTSPEMRKLTAELKAVAGQGLVIFDMPPMLVADDVIAFLPFVDAVLLISAAGQTHSQDVESCERLLPENKFLGHVLTKTDEAASSYYY